MGKAVCDTLYIHRYNLTLQPPPSPQVGPCKVPARAGGGPRRGPGAGAALRAHDGAEHTEHNTALQ